MKIRQANLSDGHSLKELSKHAINACYTSSLGEEMVNGYLSSGTSDNKIDKHIGNTFVAVDDGESTIGYVVVIDDLIHIMMCITSTAA